MGEALYRSLEGGSLAALVPNAGPLQLSGHWSLVLEQARSLRGSYVCQDMSGKEFPWQALDRLEAGDQTLNRHVLHQTEVPRSQSESHSFQSLCFAALVSFGNFGFGRRQEFVTIHDGYPKAEIPHGKYSCHWLFMHLQILAASYKLAGGSTSSCFASRSSGISAKVDL